MFSNRLGTSALSTRVNTNLEQISDWLTKILVGVGLVQLGSIIDSVSRLADYVGAPLGDAAAGPAFALSVLVYFFVVGFLLAYLWTRLNLTGAFARAEASAMRSYLDDRLDTMAKDVDERIVGVKNEVEDQKRRDVEALSLVERQLDPQAPGVNATELDGAVAAASPAVKIQVFLRAREQRASSWRQDLPRVERTIPVFEALIASDSEHRFHPHFAQLAFALKDSRPPALRRLPSRTRTSSVSRRQRDARFRGPRVPWLVFAAQRLTHLPF